jgi:hypothetical protein
VEFEPLDSEPKDDLDRELRQAFQRQPAPPGLKRRLLDERRRQRSARVHRRVVLWQRLAATLVLACTLGGLLAWRHVRQERKGQELRQQVLTAFRITNHALDQMNRQLASHAGDDQAGSQE